MGRGPRSHRDWSRPALVLTAMGALTALTGGALATAAEPSPVSQPSPSVQPTAASARRTLPRDLEPSLGDALRIRPRPYRDGCHAKAGDTRARVCTYGDEDAAFSVLIIGDSHAVQWLPALEAIAEQEGWRVYSLTKSACPVPRTPVVVRGERLRDCETWRRRAFERIERLRPDVVLAASLGRIYQVPGARGAERRERAWLRAWTRSLERLAGAADRVFLLGDTPMWREDPIVCLRRHRRDIGRCDTPRADAFSSRTEATEREAADGAGVTYLPTGDLVCPSDPCHAVEGRYLVLADEQHMTVAWARRIAPDLLHRLTCEPPATPSATPSTSPGASGTPAADGSAAPAPASASPVPGSPAPVPAVEPSPSSTPGTSVSCPR